jgi:hypothetical protein
LAKTKEFEKWGALKKQRNLFGHNKRFYQRGQIEKSF